MSYRTYILEKELAEVKAERDALDLNLKTTIETFASIVHRLDENFEVESCSLLSPTVVAMFNVYFEKANKYAKHKAKEYDLWCEWDEGQMSDEDYYHYCHSEEYAGGHWAIQEDVRDYPDEKTGED